MARERGALFRAGVAAGILVVGVILIGGIQRQDAEHSSKAQESLLAVDEKAVSLWSARFCGLDEITQPRAAHC